MNNSFALFGKKQLPFLYKKNQQKCQSFFSKKGQKIIITKFSKNFSKTLR